METPQGIGAHQFRLCSRRPLGADDHQILVQFLLEAVVLAAISATVGTLAGSAAPCPTSFPGA